MCKYNFCARYLINRWLDFIKYGHNASLDISHDLINFWEESIKNQMAEKKVISAGCI